MKRLQPVCAPGYAADTGVLILSVMCQRPGGTQFVSFVEEPVRPAGLNYCTRAAVPAYSYVGEYSLPDVSKTPAVIFNLGHLEWRN